MKFDKHEWRILQILQENSLITNQELSEKIGLSATPSWRRLNELNESGVIKKHVAILDSNLVGIKEIIFAHITVDQQVHQVASRFEDAIRLRSEILECYASMGDADYLLKVSVPDVGAYNNLLQEFLLKIPGVTQVRSNFALRTIKQSTALPIDRYNAPQEL